jgi:hypothetical protein
LKFLRGLFVTIVVIIALGVGVYYFGTNLIADKMMTQVSAELETSGQLEQIRQEVATNPQLQSFIEEGKNVDSKTLPFQTKEQATRVLMKKFSINELADIQQKAQSGMTYEEQQQWLTKIQSRLTEEELLALKVLAYKELMK